jgi:hypothetical protein
MNNKEDRSWLVLDDKGNVAQSGFRSRAGADAWKLWFGTGSWNVKESVRLAPGMLFIRDDMSN